MLQFVSRTLGERGVGAARARRGRVCARLADASASSRAESTAAHRNELVSAAGLQNTKLNLISGP